MSTSELTEGAALQQFLLLAKSVKGKGCVAVIQQALSAPNVFVFGELLEMPNVQQLNETEDKKFVDLLKIFAYGTFEDYKANAANLPSLTPPQLRKLKQLTIVSLSNKSKTIPYDVLQKQLEITELRELEDLIIDSVYQGVIHGSLDQRTKQLQVEYTMGRDLKPDDIDSMLSTLTQWSIQSELLLKTIKEKVSHANVMSDSEKKHKEDFEKRVENVKLHLKAVLEESMIQGADMEGVEFGYEGERRGKGRNKMKQRDHHPHAGREKRGV